MKFLYAEHGEKHQHFISFKMIKETAFKKAHKWQIDNIRLYLLKVGGTIRKTVKRIYFQFSKSFRYKKLFEEPIMQ